MIELAGNVFPVVIVVALQAVLTEPPFMCILVASDARGRNTKESLAQILHLDLGTINRRDLLRQVAFAARETRMLALE